jgi:hypothetical protein
MQYLTSPANEALKMRGKRGTRRHIGGQMGIEMGLEEKSEGQTTGERGDKNKQGKRRTLSDEASGAVVQGVHLLHALTVRVGAHVQLSFTATLEETHTAGTEGESQGAADGRRQAAQVQGKAMAAGKEKN